MIAFSFAASERRNSTRFSLVGQGAGWLFVDRDLDDLQSPAQGVEQGALRAAGGAGVGGDQDAGMIHHVAVAAHHAAGGIGTLHKGLVVALTQKLHVPAAQRLAPVVGLSLIGDGGLDGDVRMRPAQAQHGFEKVQVAAVCHAADVVPDAVGVDGLDHVAELLLQTPAARVVFVPAPRELCLPVPGEAAGLFQFRHDRASLDDGSILADERPTVKYSHANSEKTCNLYHTCYNSPKKTESDVFRAGCNSRPAVKSASRIWLNRCNSDTDSKVWMREDVWISDHCA